MNVPELETPQLLLRPMSLSDAPAVQKHFNNWNVIKQIGDDVPWPYPDDGAENHLRSVLENTADTKTYMWGLVLKEQSVEVIGVIEYRLSSGESDNRGFWLSESYWGQGLMTEAVVATQDFVFLKLKIDKLRVANAISNLGSQIVKERCGARKIGQAAGEYLSGDQSEEIWEITREDWLLRRVHQSLDRYHLGNCN